MTFSGLFSRFGKGWKPAWQPQILDFQGFPGLSLIYHKGIPLPRSFNRTPTSRLYRPLWAIRISKPRWIDIRISCMKTLKNWPKSTPIVTQLWQAAPLKPSKIKALRTRLVTHLWQNRLIQRKSTLFSSFFLKQRHQTKTPEPLDFPVLLCYDNYVARP